MLVDTHTAIHVFPCERTFLSDGIELHVVFKLNDSLPCFGNIYEKKNIYIYITFFSYKHYMDNLTFREINTRDNHTNRF